MLPARKVRTLLGAHQQNLNAQNGDEFECICIGVPLVLETGASFSNKLLPFECESFHVMGGECVGTSQAHLV